MNAEAARRLPSADWIAFAVAVAALCFSYVFPAVRGVLLLAVFAPSVLREIGVLNDADEWSRGITHRAGFHGLLGVAGVLVLDHLAVLTDLYEPTAAHPVPFGLEVLSKAAVWTFLVSYLIQYWGSREGAFRLLMAAAVVGLAPLFAAARHPDHVGIYLSGAGINAVAMAGPALLARRWPRLGGGVLLALLIVLVVFGAVTLDPSATSTGEDAQFVRWGMVSMWLHAGLIFGITGIALLRERS